MKLPRLKRPSPETSGFNRRRVAIAGAVLAVTLGLLTYLLTRSPGGPIVRTEPAVTASAKRPPLELLESPDSGAETPVPEPPPNPLLARGRDPLELPVPREISPRVIKAFSQSIPYARRASHSTTVRPGASAPSELSAVFEDLEAQNRALGELLKQDPASLSPTSLDEMRDQLTDATPSARRQAPPATRHQQARIQPPQGPFLLRQGTVIPAQLLTEINSDLPGQVLAHVASDVRDSLSFRHLLLPRGTKLVGSYASGLGTGQNRLAVAWTRMLLPDGSAIDVAGLPAVDAQGRSGLRDRVNHHTARIFGNALLLSLLSAGFEAAQPNADQLRLSTGELAAQGASGELERAASELLRRNASIPPTVRVRAGRRFNVFLTGDLTFAKPYSQ